MDRPYFRDGRRQIGAFPTIALNRKSEHLVLLPLVYTRPASRPLSLWEKVARSPLL